MLNVTVNSKIKYLTNILCYIKIINDNNELNK